LEPAEFEAAWAEGQAAPLGQIIAEALEECPQTHETDGLSSDLVIVRASVV
jgi:hypothetical protein